MSKHGELTANIGESLKFEGFDVFYDHGSASENVGKIISSIEKEYGREDELSQLDIAIVERSTGNAVALIEIEETADRPKTFLGDLLSVLCGEHISFKGKEFKVGAFTTLIVIGVSKMSHKERNQYIIDKVEKIKSALGTKNSAIGKVMIETCTDEMELSIRLPSLLDKAIKGEL